MRYKKEGSFTIEAALIMPFVLGIIMLFIYIGMFAFDRCTIEYVCQETVCAAVYDNNDSENEATERILSNLSERLILDWDMAEAKTDLFNRTFVHTAKAHKHFCPKY